MRCSGPKLPDTDRRWPEAKIQVLINQANLKFESSTEGHRPEAPRHALWNLPSVWKKKNATLLFPHRLGKGASLESIGAFSTATHSADDDEEEEQEQKGKKKTIWRLTSKYHIEGAV
jgi:hypothetical protein